MFFAPFLEEEISDYIAHGPIIRVLTVASERYRVTCHGNCSWMRKAQRRTSSMIDGGNDIFLNEKGRTRTPRESTSSFVQFLYVTPHEPQEKKTRYLEHLSSVTYTGTLISSAYSIFYHFIAFEKE